MKTETNATDVHAPLKSVPDGETAIAEVARRGESRLRELADAIPQIIWICDGQGRLQFFNQQWTNYTGFEIDYARTEEQARAVLHPDDYAATLEAWEQACRNGTSFYVEHRMRSASGQYRWFMARAEPRIDVVTGRIHEWFGTSTDVHDHRMAQDALQESEARYRSLFESIDEGFCVIEVLFDASGTAKDYRFLEVNPIFEAQTGLCNAVGKTMREMVPDHEDHWFEMYGGVALTGQPIRVESEARKLHRWYDVYAFRIDHPSARRVAILFTDITARRKAEEEMRQGNRRKDEFLAMLAHELRNPLAPIAAAADLLRLAQPDDARVRKSSEIISRQVRHMTALINDLLDVSRVTSGLVTLDTAVVDVRQIVTEAVEQVRPLIDARRHRLHVEMQGRPLLVSGDGKRLLQVFANVLNNAAKYTPEGGDIRLDAFLEQGQVVVTVADNGVGMDAPMLERAFEMFTQAERTADRAQGGLGIGLALVRSLAELHGGGVSAQSRGLGEGCVFTVRLPASMAQLDHWPPASQAQECMNTSLRLLVVDDNADAAAMLAMFLEAAGHEVMVESDSRRALERARLERPDVCLLDVGLPDMDGCALARRLRAQPENAATVLIAITGYGQERDRLLTSAAGFAHHLVKPVDTDALVALLDRLAQAGRAAA